MRDLGFDLGEIECFVRMIERGSYPCADFRRAVAARATEVRRRITEIRQLERTLGNVTARCGGAEVAHCRVIDTLSDPGCCGPPG